MGYRDTILKSVILMIGVIALIYVLKTQQWELVKEYLTKFISYENGGLP